MNKNIMIVIVIIVAAVAALVGVVFMVNHMHENEMHRVALDSPITVTDAIGKEVTVKYKIDRVALCDISCLEMFATSYGEGWEDKVCLMPSDISSRDASLGDYIEKTWPKLKEVDKCPDLFSNLGTNPNSVAEAIVNSDPDLVILPGATIEWFTELDSFYNILNESEIPVFNQCFHTRSLTPTIAELNYGSLGKILQKEQRGNEIVNLYNTKLKIVTDRMAEKDRTDIRIYSEVMMGNPREYGYVNNANPEQNIIGQNILEGTGVTFDRQFNLEKLINANPDWIILSNTAYYGEKQLLGYYVKEDKAIMATSMQAYLNRNGWSDLKAVKNKQVFFKYGEFKNTMMSIYDLYVVANMMRPDVVSDKELEDLKIDLNKYLPWEIEGTFKYVME